METNAETDEARTPEEAAIETLQEAAPAPAAARPAAPPAPADPLRDLLAEDLRDTLLERLPEAQRQKVADAVKGDDILDQIKFIKRYSKLQPPAVPAQLPVGNNSSQDFDVVVFSEQARKQRAEKQAKSMYR